MDAIGRQTFLRLFFFAVVYFLVAHAGLLLTFPNSSLITIWFPTGIAFTAVLLWGPRYLIAIFIGSFFLYTTSLSAMHHSILFAAVNTLEAGTAWFIARRWKKIDTALVGVEDIFNYVLIISFVPTIISATLGTVIVASLYTTLWDKWFIFFIGWWLGNYVSAIVVVPLILTIRRTYATHQTKNLFSFIMLSVIIVFASMIIFFGELRDYALSYILFPFTILISYRHRHLGAVTATFIIAICATIASQSGSGLFSGKDAFESLVLVDGLIIVQSIISLLIASVIEGRDSSEQELRQSEHRFRAITHAISVPVEISRVSDGKILYANPHLHSLFEVAENTLLGNTTVNFYADPADRDPYIALLKVKQRLSNYEIKVRSGRGRIFTVLISAELTRFQDEEAIVTSFFDLTERKLFEQRLAESEEHFRMLIEKGTEGITVIDQHAKITYVAPSVKTILGYSETEVMGKKVFELLHPDDYHQYKKKLLELVRINGKSLYALARLRKADGEWIFVESTLTNLYLNPVIRGIVINFRDVTQRIVDETQIKQSLQEKEILLKEVHHRVKNNMQVISSLLNVHAHTTGSKNDQGLIQESQNRIKSMALAHEILYTSGDLSHVHLPRYVKQLTDSLHHSFGIGGRNIEFIVKVTHIRLSLDQAIPFGLIINELVSNAVKYAFPSGRGGTVTVSIKKIGKDKLRLEVNDNGIGGKQKRSTNAASSLGLTLIEALVDQLKGVMTIENSKGTNVTIVIPLQHQSTATA